jgi:protein TIF31
MKEEAKDTAAEQDLLKDKPLKIERHMMPLCWLEMLECEMVARAAKHVLDRYLSLNGGAAALQPAFLVSSFLSALMCTSEESAAETERRLEKEGSEEEDVESLSIFTSSGGGLLSLVPGRREVWADIEKEIGRRFRYVLHLYNNKDIKISSRALLIPLLRRVCQRTGVRLYANNYKIGGKGLCSAIGSYPISASDIAEIVPLVKHAANGTGEGFVPCSTGAASASSYLHILLPDASAAFEAAQAHAHARNLPKALDLVQETTSLYQRVVDSTLHSRISRCLDITAGILFQAQELDLARSNATKALAVAIQMGGFDCAEVIPLRTTLCHILLTSGCISSAVKHIRANMYLLELLAGPRHVDLSSTYQRLGTIYQEIGSYIPALRLFQEAIMRKNPDRVVEGMLRHASANLLATMGQFKGACEAELRATQVFQIVLGSDHEHTKNSSSSQKVSVLIIFFFCREYYVERKAETISSCVQQYYKLAIQQELKRKEDDKKQQEEEAANAVASEIAADEAAEEKKKAKKKKKGKKKK